MSQDAAPSKEKIVDAVFGATFVVTGFDRLALRGHCRGHELVCARHAAMWLMLEMVPGMTISRVARLFARDHSTVTYMRHAIYCEAVGEHKPRIEIASKVRTVAHRALAGEIDLPRTRSAPDAPSSPGPELCAEVANEIAMHAVRKTKFGYVDNQGAIICLP